MLLLVLWRELLRLNDIADRPGAREFCMILGEEWKKVFVHLSCALELPFADAVCGDVGILEIFAEAGGGEDRVGSLGGGMCCGGDSFATLFDDDIAVLTPE